MNRLSVETYQYYAFEHAIEAIHKEIKNRYLNHTAEEIFCLASKGWKILAVVDRIGYAIEALSVNPKDGGRDEELAQDYRDAVIYMHEYTRVIDAIHDIAWASSPDVDKAAEYVARAVYFMYQEDRK